MNWFSTHISGRSQYPQSSADTSEVAAHAPCPQEEGLQHAHIKHFTKATLSPYKPQLRPQHNDTNTPAALEEPDLVRTLLNNLNHDEITHWLCRLQKRMGTAGWDVRCEGKPKYRIIQQKRFCHPPSYPVKLYLNGQALPFLFM